ncbi:ATP-binding cassette domain-containing protein [Nocardia cyriacigeorgica]|uniref:FHA domain-containing protein n=1 Tax=Nocardia cyriacigeorgica TaxID=135487 RepID=UPI0015E43FF7|nr:FHA domain-containing protein [Nocardia cyriacigeorgica]MBF6087048.1 ATP-binding cassette domain-containing protein [Nocardia cyriacigeorgica]MBF6093015.1 ATP-binding cassette domain-containing protein [Nocardia cyriacigeorgica]MBF6319828.1 ATP-binding cassette domain-containing protein [Nocardia cyriacigeorgica]MBF6325158.1 ATP-binding cassette domain-containing protein [Nocardia cyriacigeorgica]MBF6397611.1 ATP-binding cassette domain-containing protein [Nocardia cyriacigeorgica]
MSSPGAQTITVRHDGTERIFDSSQQVTMGRAPEVTLFVDSPLVSRVHAILAWQGGAWVLRDNGSTNGVFVDAARLSRPVSIDRPIQVRLGDAITGPLLHLLPAAPQSRPPQHSSQPQHPVQPPRQGLRPPPAPPQRPHSGPQSGASRIAGFHSAPQPQPAAPNVNINMTTKADTSSLPPVRARPSTSPIARADRLPAGGLAIGRTADNQIVVNDPLASRRHARLVAGSEGLTIEDLGSANGTFVNGVRQQRTVLRERDIITIGNVDFVVQQGTLVHRQRPVAEQGLHVHGVGFTVEGNKQLLVDVNLQAGRGTLTALIGPSGAGKSTLSKLIAGNTQPSGGVVTFEGRNLHAEYEALRSRIGMVPQDDVLHRQLTVRQALGFAAELRLPPDTSSADRQQVIDGVLKELSLTEHADTRVDRLSGGQRKRASVALELLTGPSLLILDEPTSGLDPALDRQVMVMLRELADAGRVVIVVTHSVACLDMCDQVVLLAPGGKTAYAGNPAGVGSALGTSDWAEIFANVAANPDQAFAAYRSRQAFIPPPPPPAPMRHGAMGSPPQSSGWRQFSTLVRRQVRLILADRGYLAFLVILPFVLGVLTLVVPGENGFAPGPQVPVPGPNGEQLFVHQGGGETQQLLVVLVLGACFMGSTLTVRDLVGERTIFFRERAVGLLPSAYAMAKIVVFSVAALLQSAVLIGIALAGKNPPGAGALIPSGSLELYIGVAFTAVSCVVVGLALSTLAKSNEQVMPLLVVTIMVQLVMAGGMIPVTDRVVLEQISWLFPSRWGYAAAASTVDIRTLFANAQPDKLWEHSAGIWLLDIAMLLVVTAILSVVTWHRLRLKKTAS